jgi:hypothetical protein
VPAYRLFHLDDAGHVIRAESIAADDDEQAIGYLFDRKLSRRCELWDRDRLVVQYPLRPKGKLS